MGNTPSGNNLPAPLPELTAVQLATLAREIAAGDSDDPHHIATVLGRYNLTRQHLTALKRLPYFRQALETAIIEWNSTLNTKQRMSVIAAWMLEQALPHLAARMMKPDEDLNKAVETGKLFAKVAGIGERLPGEAALGEKISITIDLGGDHVVKIDKDVAPVTQIEGIVNGTDQN